jgi:hypothetical protein
MGEREKTDEQEEVPGEQEGADRQQEVPGEREEMPGEQEGAGGQQEVPGEPERVYAPGSDERVDLTKEVSSVRPADLDVPDSIVDLISYAVPKLVGTIRRKEMLPPVLVLMREGDATPSVEPIEEEMRNPDDLIAYTERRLAADEREQEAHAQEGRDGSKKGKYHMGPIKAYLIMYDERRPGFTVDGGPGASPDGNPLHDEKNMSARIVAGSGEAATGVCVRQRFRPGFFRASLLGAPVIERGPDSLLFGR